MDRDHIEDQEYAESCKEWVDDLLCSGMDALYRWLPYLAYFGAGVCFGLALGVFK